MEVEKKATFVTPEQLEFFRQNGYLHYGPILTPEELKELQDEIQRLIDLKNPDFFRQDLGGKGDTSPGKEKFLQMTGLWRASDVVRKYAFQHKRASIAAALLGVEHIRLLTDMVLTKPGRDSRPTYWHQDFPGQPNSLPDLTAWIALDATTVANGCMQYLPGSHRWGEVLGYDYADGSNVTRKGVDTSRAMAVEMRPGEVTFHHALTAHSAGANTTDKGRRAYIVRYCPAQAVHRAGRVRAALYQGPEVPAAVKQELEDDSFKGQPFDESNYPTLV